LFRCFGRSYKQ